MSILSFPDRGRWGDAAWRGNCSGYIYQELFQRLKPGSMCDPMKGSGTSIEVAQEMQIEAFGLDLHEGFNAVRDSILNEIGKPVDLCISHPPYGAMIIYSGPGGMWGTAAHPDDLSRCETDQEFHEKLQLALLNQREATKGGGYYATIIGDWRRQGKYTSYQAECISRMPSDELAAVLIKQQHNMKSNSQSYASMKLPFILHEYILIWQKKSIPFLSMLAELNREQQQRLKGTWKNIVKVAMSSLGGAANLKDLYEFMAANAPDKLATNPNWREKVRQTLNSNATLFSSDIRGQWKLVA